MKLIKSGTFKIQDLTGKTFGKLTVIEKVPDSPLWRVRCTCGTIKKYPYYPLKRFIKSCGSNECRRILDPIEATLRMITHIYKKAARRSKKSYDLSRQDLKKIVFSKCFYCGSLPVLKKGLFKRKEDRGIRTNGLDRKNSNLGYTKKNCVPCCKTCNKIKLDYSFNFFLKKMKRISLSH